MDNELFELCKEVYKRTGWSETLACWEQTDGVPEGEPYIAYPELERRYGLWGTQEMKKRTPLYTSDYLLEKLPKKAKFGKREMGFVLTSSTTDSTWVADYFSGGWTTGLPEHTSDLWLHHGNRAKETEADTPLKALLKLVISLDDAGVLKDNKAVV